VPLEQATTSSLEALQAFATGLKIAWTKGPAAALEYHQRAIQLDPNFAMGYRQLGAEYDTLGELGRAREYFSTAFELRDHTCEHKRLSVTRNVGCRCITQLLQGNAQNVRVVVRTEEGQLGRWS